MDGPGAGDGAGAGAGPGTGAGAGPGVEVAVGAGSGAVVGAGVGTGTVDLGEKKLKFGNPQLCPGAGVVVVAVKTEALVGAPGPSPESGVVGA